MSNLVQSICWVTNGMLNHIHETQLFNRACSLQDENGEKSHFSWFSYSHRTCTQIFIFKNKLLIALSIFYQSRWMAKVWPGHPLYLILQRIGTWRGSVCISLSLLYVECLEGFVWAITLGSHEIPHLVKDRVYDPALSLFLTSSFPPSSEKVKLKATCMMAKVQVWNVSIVCVQFKNNISRRVQSLQVAPLGLLLFQSRDIYPRKRWKWWGNRVHMLGKYAGRDWRKNNILPQVAALFLNFFFPFRLEPAISCALSSTFCGFLTAG